MLTTGGRWAGRRPVRLHVAGVVVLLVIAAAIRLYALDAKSFWLDEFLTAHAARFGSWDEVFAWIHLWIDHPPFHTTLTWLLRPFGADEFAVRLPVAAAGIASVGAMYALGSTLERPRVGFLAALLLAVSTYAVWYAQEARPYSFVILFTLVQMLFAARVARDGRRRDWAALGAISILFLYTSYLALATTLAVVVFLGIACLLGLTHRSTSSPEPTSTLEAWRARPKQFAVGAFVTGAVVGLSYLPWLPFLFEFLARPDLGFGRIDAGHQATVGEVIEVFRAVGLGDPIVLLLTAIGGLVVVAETIRGRRSSSALLATWLAVGVGILVVRAQGGVVTIWPRYLAYLVPAGILLAALGADRLAGAIGRTVPEGHRAAAGLLSYAVLAAVVLLPAPRLLAEHYATPKGEDYRSAARLIGTDAGPGAVVLAVGPNSDWLTEGLAHDLWVMGSTTPVVDAARLDASAVEAIASAKHVVLARLQPSGDPMNPAEIDPAALTGWTKSAVPGITIAVAPPGSTAIDAAMTSLDWAATLDNRFEAARLVVMALQPSSASTPDLLTGVGDEQWTLPPGAAFDGPGSLKLDPAGAQLNASVTIPLDGSARRMVLVFDCQSRMERGATHVYAVALDPQDEWAIFPTGAGYACPDHGGVHRGAFLIDLPEGADRLMVIVRADGIGTAEASSIRLIPAPSR